MYRLHGNFKEAKWKNEYWVVIISDGLFGVACNLKEISKSSMSDIMAQSTKDNSKDFKRGQYLSRFNSIRQ